MWCLWQSLPCSIQCLSLATTLCFAESDLVAFAPPLGMACVWTWLWQATLPLCRDCLLRRRCGRQAGQCDTPPAFIRRWQLQLCRCRLWLTCVFMAIGASVSTPRRCFISSRRPPMPWRVSAVGLWLWDCLPPRPMAQGCIGFYRKS